MAAGSVLVMSGEIDYVTAPAWGAVVSAALRDRPSTLVLDLSGVTFIDSSGLGMLVGIHTRCDEQSVRLGVTPLPTSIRYLLHLTGLDAIFDEISTDAPAAGEVGTDRL